MTTPCKVCFSPSTMGTGYCNECLRAHHFQTARPATPAVDDEVAIILAKEIEGKVYETPPLIYYRALHKLRPYLAPKQQDGGLVEKIRAAKNPDPKNVGYNQGLETAIEICQQHTAEQSVMGEGDN